MILHLPIVLRELRTAAAEHQVLRHRDFIARWVAVGMVILILFEWAGVGFASYLAFPIFLSATLTAAILPAHLFLGLILEERRAGTLGSLFLAGVTPSEFFLSKVIAAVSMLGSLLVGLLPVISLPFLTGGLSAGTFLGMVSLLPALTLASLGISLLISTLASNEARAFSTAWMVAGVWSGALPVFYWTGKVVTGTPSFSESRLALTPLYPLMLLGDGLNALNTGMFWRAIEVLLGVGVSTLFCAALILPKQWRRDLAAPANLESHGNRSRQRPISEAEPMEGLLRPERSKVRWYAAALVAFFLFWLGGALAWGKAWLATSLALALILLVFLLVSTAEDLLLTSCVGRIRRDGAFEELLATPLSSADVVDGFVAGFEKMLRPVRRLAAVLSSVIGLTAACTRTWTPASAMVYALVGGGLIFLTGRQQWSRRYGLFRLAVLTGSTVRSFGHAGNWMAVLCGQGFNFYRLFRHLRSLGSLPTFPTGDGVEIFLTVTGFILISVFVFWPTTAARRAYAVDELRRLVAEPMAQRKDPRLAGWKADSPTPPMPVAEETPAPGG